VESVLENVRVVELTEALAGPYCAMLLGDLGADVVKVERPGVGDQSRGWGPPFVGSESAYYLALNRNKRSIALNYDNPLAADVLHRLISTADVFIINQPSIDSLKKRGLDSGTLCARYPKLIYCSITGYGWTGPKAGMPVYDILAQAEAGVMSFTGEAGGDPMRYPVAIADMTGGIYSAMSILAALLARTKTGRGQFLDMALFDSQISWLGNAGSSFLNAGVSPERCGNAHPNIVPYDAFRAGDGKYFVVGVGTEPLWKRFLKTLELEKEWGMDSRFQSNALRIENREHLIPLLKTKFLERDAKSWLEGFARAEIPAAQINTVSEAFADEQTRTRGLIVELEHPSLGTARSIANPMRLSATPVSYRLPPPMLGEHTSEVLHGLGYASDQIRLVVGNSAT
jgi:crotonobetainyl-CoA:carnitine CoA-transferase CaiB-like acyl-CoA transferase